MSGAFQFLSNALQSLVDFVTSIFSLVINTIQGLLSFFLNIPKFLNYLSASIGFLPSFVSVFATVTVAIAVIYVILGRGGKDG